MLLIKMRLLIFLVLSGYGLTCKCGEFSKCQYTIGCRNAFPCTWNTIANQATLKQKLDSTFKNFFKFVNFFML